MVEGIEVFKKCRNVVFLNYILVYFCRFCGEVFLKLVIINGKIKLVVKKIFCYKSFEDSLKILVMEKGLKIYVSCGEIEMC